MTSSYDYCHWLLSSFSFSYMYDAYLCGFLKEIYGYQIESLQNNHHTGMAQNNWTPNSWLGGGFNTPFFHFHPEPWGRWTHFDVHIFRWVETYHQPGWKIYHYGSNCWDSSTRYPQPNHNLRVACSYGHWKSYPMTDPCIWNIYLHEKP